MLLGILIAILSVPAVVLAMAGLGLVVLALSLLPLLAALWMFGVAVYEIAPLRRRARPARH